MNRATCLFKCTKGYVKVTDLFLRTISTKPLEQENSPGACNSVDIFTWYRVYAFGLMEHGALGLDNPKNKIQHSTLKRYFRRPIRHFFAELNKVNGVACGYGFTAFSVNSDNLIKVYGCGINTDQQLGRQKYEIINSPLPIDIGIEDKKTKVKRLSAGRAHLAILTDNEGVFLLGSNCYGQCGRKADEKSYTVGNRIFNLGGEPVADVLCGQDHTLFLTEAGEVFSCGWGADGQTGQNITDNICVPTEVKGELSNEVIVKLAGCTDTVLCLNDKGVVFGWGNTEYLQLTPDKNIQHYNTPKRLLHLEKCGKIIDIAAGGTFCLALNENGQVFVWGYGILGAGPQVERSPYPLLLPMTLFGRNEFQPEAKVISVFCGLGHLAAINSYHHLYTWGKNKDGCLGIGHAKDQFFPYKVALSAEAYKVSCGVDHTMVLCRPLVD